MSGWDTGDWAGLTEDEWAEIPEGDWEGASGAGWVGPCDAGWLSEWFAGYPPDTPVRVTVRFPDLDWVVTDWAFGLRESPTEPGIEVSVYGDDFDYPDAIRKLRRFVDFAARNNLLDD